MIRALVAVAIVAASPSKRTQPPRPPPSAFALLRANAGVPSAVPDFCSLFASELTGNYFCLNGDGTQRSAAATTLSAVGSPVSQSQRTCPNGPNCGSYTSQRITSGNRYATAAVAAPTGSFSVGCFARLDTSSDMNVSTHWTTALPSLAIQVTSGAATLYTSDGTATTSQAGGTITPSAWHLIGASFTFSGAGAVNGTTVYVDGVAGTPSTTMRPPQSAATVGYALGATQDNQTQMTGNVGPCFLTEKVITAQTWAAMASALIPTVSGSRGETITYSRASTATCTADDGSVSVLPSGRPCVNGSGLLVEPSATNRMLRSEEFDNAVWVPNLISGKTANATTAPNSTLTADQIDFGASPTSGSGVIQSDLTESSSTTYTFSVWLWTNSGTKSMRLSRTDRVSWATATVGPTLTVTTTPQRFSLTFTTGGADTASDIAIGGEGKTPFTPSAGIIYAWGAQLEAGSIATSYVPTAGTAATRATVAPTVATTGWPTARGSIEVSYTPASGTAVAIYPLIDSRATAGTSGIILYRASTDQLIMAACDSTCPTFSSGVLAWTSGQTYRIRVAWGGGVATVYRDDVQVATGATGTPTAHAASALLGHSLSSERLQGSISNLSVRP